MSLATTWDTRAENHRADRPAAVEIDRLELCYGGVAAVRGLSMRAAAGDITAILGPNGAGKSTVLKALCTLVAPAAGSVRVFGADARREALAVRRHLGVVFQETTLDRELSVERNLRFHAYMYGMGRIRAARRIDAVLDAFDLTGRRRDPVERLSGGLTRRVEIARALLHEPRLLVLDEPTTGLDPESRQRVWQDLRSLRAELGVTILYSTHYLDEAEYADQVVIIGAGRVVRAGSPVELKTGMGSSSVLLRTRDDDGACRNLRAAGFPAEPVSEGVSVPARDPERLVASLVVQAAVPVLSVSVRHPSMDDVFLAATERDLTGHHGAEAI